MEETFTYDGMNRLTGVTLKRPSGRDLVCAVTYDALGRMTSRQAVTAENGAPQVTSVFSDAVYNTTAKPHAMDAATTAEGVFPATPQAVTYTGFDTSSLWRTFVAGPYGVFAVVESRNGINETHYVLKDNLGSWTTITDGNGTVEQRLSYDAWGNLRDPNTWANYTVGDTFDKPMFDRGYTGHEHLTEFGLINMNGRVYDPVMSSFLSADRFVQNPLTAQGFNRYSYCMNNPLRFIDPTGWLPGDGGSGGSLPHIIIGGQTNYILPEITIRPDDNPSLSNPHEKPNYPTYYYGGSPTDLPAWGDPSNGPSIGWSNGTGCGGGSGTHGGNNNNTTPGQNVNVEISSNIDLSKVNVTCFYINSGNTVINNGAELASVLSAGSKEASVFEKIATHSKILGIIGVGINIGCTSCQMYYGEMPKHEGVVRIGMTGVEFGLTFVPYVGPLLSIGLTAYDIGGGFDDNLYKTENWWKEKQP